MKILGWTLAAIVMFMMLGVAFFGVWGGTMGMVQNG